MAESSFFARILTLFTRKECAACGASVANSKDLCEWCRLRLYRNMWPHCSSSGEPLIDSGISSGIVIHSALKHDGAARELLVMMKYRSRKTLSCVIADLLTEFADELPGPGDIVVPLPLGKQREKERGFNQSYLIAKYFCRNTGASLMKLLTREDRHPQVGLTSRERRDNIKGAYSVIHSGIPPGIETAIWLLDDVTTTGSSMHAAARALKDSGFSRITGITFTYRSIDPYISPEILLR